uniref:hypothetical protein n=1 Tax=Burkholderia diffusa TaxID=488732 RepID=UPI001CC70F5A|nr:hypothetical protein [Burkholderia diffusa]
MNRPIAVASLGAVVAVGAVLLASTVGRVAGEQAGSRSKERLQLVWPSIMDMPTNDRALLVGLAMTCRVEDRPAIAGDVVECLRDALDDPHALLPKGVDRDAARIRLDQLLRQRRA